MSKNISLFLMMFIVCSIIYVIFINEKNNWNSENLVRILRESKDEKTDEPSKSAMEIGIIVDTNDGEEKIAAVAAGEIGKESEQDYGLAIAEVISDDLSGNYLDLSFKVSSTVSLMSGGTAIITAYNNLNGHVLSSTKLTATSGGVTNNLNKEFFMWVGNASQVKITISEPFVTVDTGFRYPLVLCQSFILYR